MGKSIKEVAAEAGFRDYYYFLKAFKRVRGTTPGTFQRTFHTTLEESGTRPPTVSKPPPRVQRMTPGVPERPERVACEN